MTFKVKIPTNIHHIFIHSHFDTKNKTNSYIEQKNKEDEASEYVSSTKKDDYFCLYT